MGFLFQLSQNVLPTIFVLYTGYRYGWTPRILGFTFMATGTAQVLVQMFMVGPLVKRIGERGSVLIGAGAGALAFLIYAVAPNGFVYLSAVPIYAMVGFLQPGVMGLMSRRVSPTHQGRLQGVNQSFMGISSIIGPPLYGLTFAWSLRHAGNAAGSRHSHCIRIAQPGVPDRSADRAAGLAPGRSPPSPDNGAGRVIIAPKDRATFPRY